MDNKTNLDKKIEATLKANLNSISASDDLIFKTLARLDQMQNNPGATVTAIPKKKKKSKVPVAIISSIAAIAVATIGGLYLFSNSAMINKSADHIESNAENVKAEEYLGDVSNDSAKAFKATDSAYEEEEYSDSADGSVNVYSPKNTTVISLKGYTRLANKFIYTTYVCPDTSVPTNPYYTDTIRTGYTTTINNDINFDEANQSMNENDKNHMAKFSKPAKSLIDRR